jgi:hypothetical protein
MMTLDGVNETLYLNGVQVVNRTPYTGFTEQMQLFRIADGAFATGPIWHVGMWLRAFSASEVWNIANVVPWDLYWQPNTRAYSFLQSAAAFDATQFPHIPLDVPYIVPTKMVPSGRVS